MRTLVSLLFVFLLNRSFAQQSLPPDFMVGRWALDFGHAYFSKPHHDSYTDTTDCRGGWYYEFLASGFYLSASDSLKAEGNWELKNNVLVLSNGDKRVFLELNYISPTRIEFPYTWDEKDGQTTVYIHLRRIPSK